MTVQEAGWLRDAYNLVFNYGRNDAKRTLVNSTLLHNNKPVFFYINALVRFSLQFGKGEYYRYYKESFQRDTTYFTNRTARNLWQDSLPNRLSEFFRKCEADKGEFNRVLQTVNSSTPAPSIYSEVELRRITELENQRQQGDVFIESLQKVVHAVNKSEEEKKLYFRIKKYQKDLLNPKLRAKLVENGHFTHEELTEIDKLGLAHIENFKNRDEWQKQVGVADKRLRVEKLVHIKQVAQVAEEVSAEVLENIAQQPQSAEPFTPTAIQTLPRTRTLPSPLLQTPQKAAGFGKLLFRTPLGWGILGAIFLFLFMPIFLSMNEATSLMPPFQETSFAAPITVSDGTIDSCQFTRSGVSKPVKSSKLRGIFQKVSQKSGIPASVLASVAMHENPDFTINADDNHDAFSNIGFVGPQCQPHFTTSPTGALGLMQIQPPLTILPTAHAGAYSVDGLTRGAKMLDRTYESLTMRDFCDVRTSVFLGAGVLLAKNGGQPPTAGDQIQSAVCGYFGSPCTYPGGFNYGDDAKKDFLACQGGIVSCPVNGGHITTGSKTTPGGHCSPSYLAQGNTCVLPGQSGYTGRDTAVDIQGSNKNVFLPKLGDGSAIWTIDESRTPINDSEGGGIAVGANASFNGHSYRIRFVHIISTSLNVGQKPKSGEIIGQYNGNAKHVHITLQEDGIYKPADLYFNLCQ